MKIAARRITTGKPWEAGVTGPDQLRLARWADQLGFADIAVPEHHIIPRAYVPQAGPHHLSAYAGMAAYAGATEKIRVNSCIALLPVQSPIITAKTLATMDWISGGRVTITHAAVRESHRGYGVGAKLIGSALDDLQAAGGPIRVTCPVVRAFIERNPRYAPLLDRP